MSGRSHGLVKGESGLYYLLSALEIRVVMDWLKGRVVYISTGCPLHGGRVMDWLKGRVVYI